MIGQARGLRYVDHGGGWAGYWAELVRIPEQRTSVAVLCNLAAANSSQLARRVVEVVLEVTMAPPTPPPAPTGTPTVPPAIRTRN